MYRLSFGSVCTGSNNSKATWFPVLFVSSLGFPIHGPRGWLNSRRVCSVQTYIEHDEVRRSAQVTLVMCASVCGVCGYWSCHCPSLLFLNREITLGSLCPNSVYV